jgi:hypothetical protein
VGTLLDCFDRPRTVRVHWAGRHRDVRVPALTLRDLCDLQAFLRDRSWDPWAVPDVDDMALMLACVIVESDCWPPPLWTEVAGLAVGSEEYQDEFTYVAVGRHNGLDRRKSAVLGRIARGDFRTWQRILGAAYGERPEDAASRILNVLDGAPFPSGPPIDWGLAVAELVVGGEGRRGMSFAEAEGLTLPQFRLLRRAYRDKEGRMRLAPSPGTPPAAREGETAREAECRRRAILDEARAVLEARYSGAGGPPQGEDGRDQR